MADSDGGLLRHRASSSIRCCKIQFIKYYKITALIISFFDRIKVIDEMDASNKKETILYICSLPTP